MENKYLCSICGKTHYDLGEYVDCVTRCSEKLKEQEEKEKERKRAEEINAALNKVKQAKAYFEQQLKEFEEKYPEEYKFNFAEEKDCCDDKKTCGGTCGGCKDTNTCNPVNNWLEFSYKNDGKNTPEVHASVNGKKVSDDALEKLFEDPDTKYLAKLLGIL